MAALKAAQMVGRRKTPQEEARVLVPAPVVEVVEVLPLEVPQTPVASAELPEPEEAVAEVIDFAAAKSKILAKRYLSQGVLE